MTLRGKAAIVGIGEVPTRRSYTGRTVYGLCADAARMAIEGTRTGHHLARFFVAPLLRMTVLTESLSYHQTTCDFRLDFLNRGYTITI